MSDSDDPKVPAETILAASRALEIIGVILEDDELRGAFSTAPEATFNSARDHFAFNHFIFRNIEHRHNFLNALTIKNTQKIIF